MGGLLGLFADVFHAFRNVARDALIQGGLLISGSSGLRVPSADAFGEPKQQSRGGVVQFFRHWGWIVFFE